MVIVEEIIRLDVVMNNIQNINNIPFSKFAESIVIAFRNYEFNGVGDIVIKTIKNRKQYIVYINEANTPIIYIDTITDENDMVTVINVFFKN